MLGHGLSGSESAGDRRCSALRNGEHGIQDPLPCDQRYAGRISLAHRSWHTDGPVLGHGKLPPGPVSQLDGHNGILDGILAIRHGLHYRSLHIGRNHAFVHNGRSLRNLRDDGPAAHQVSRLHGYMGIPQLLAVQRIYADTPGDKRAAAFRDPLQGALDPVEDIIQDSRRQRHRDGRPCGFHRLPRTQA